MKSYPDSTLTNSFYTDQTEINILHFRDCDIQVIQANAFLIKALQNLKCLNIHQATPVEFKLNAFHGLNDLNDFNLINVTIKNGHYRMLEPIALTVKQLLFNGLSGNWYNIIGSRPLRNLRTIKLVRISFYIIITLNSLPNMPSVTWIHFAMCDTEVILLGAFDRFGDTLEKLTMYANRLKTVPAQLFDHMKRLSGPGIELLWNPVQCDCDTLALMRKYGNIFEMECREDLLIDANLDCNRPQQLTDPLNLTEARACWRHYGTNALRVNFITAYRIRVSAEKTKLMFTNSRRNHFYILIITDAAAKFCLSISAKYASVSLKNIINPFGIKSVAVIENGQVSPMHFISFYLHNHKLVWLRENCRAIMVVCLLAIYSGAFILALLLGIYLVNKNFILLKRLDRVILEREKTTNKIETVLVMPRSWVTMQKSREYETSKCWKNCEMSMEQTVNDANLEPISYTTDQQENSFYESFSKYYDFEVVPRYEHVE